MSAADELDDVLLLEEDNDDWFTLDEELLDETELELLPLTGKDKAPLVINKAVFSYVLVL